MTENVLRKAIGLVKKTQLPCFVLNETDESGVAVVPIEVYEKMAVTGRSVLTLTKDEFLDKINRDINTWKSVQSEADLQSWEENNVPKTLDLFELSKNVGENSMPETSRENPEKQHYFFEPIN